MRKILLIILAFSLQINAQYNPLSPWMKDLKSKSSKKEFTLKEISDAFNAYWEIHKDDKDKKGSGYKPFKRWESRWSSSLDKEGKLIKSTEIWNAWREKNAMTQRRSDVSNWQNLGPFTQMSNTGIGRVNVAAIDPNNSNTYYVGAPAGGLWKTTDAGISWTPLTDHLPQIGVSGIAIDPNNSNIIYIATGDDDHNDTLSIGVLKSIDGGATWNQTGLTFSGYASSNEIYINPTNSNMVWVATSYGVYKTINGGDTWNNTLSGNVIDLKLQPSNPDIVYAVTNNTFYKSTNAGDSFTQMTTGLPNSSGRFSIDVTPANSDVVYLLSADTSYGFQGIYKSTNAGNSFTQTGEGSDIFGGSTQAWYDMALSVSDTDENTLFVGVLDIWKSTDGGTNFNQINVWYDSSDSAYTHADIHFLRYFNGDLFCGSDGGFYKSTNNGDTFNAYNDGLAISQLYRIANANQSSSKIAGGLQDNGGFGYNGSTWNRYHGGDGMDCAVSPTDENVYYGFTQYGGYLSETTNAGSYGDYLWYNSSEDSNFTGNWVTPLVINRDGDLYAGYQKLYRFDFYTYNWFPISGDVFGGNLDCIEIDPNDPNLIYVSRWSDLYKSTDKGYTFTYVNSFSNNITSIEINNNNSSTVYITTGNYSGGSVYKSIDGNSFTDISGNMPYGDSKNIIKHQPNSTLNDLYVGTSLGVYYRNDTMSDWEAFSTDLPNVPVRDLEINTIDHKLIAGTFGRGVWVSSLVNESYAAVEEQKLTTIQIFPNPSKGLFTIKRHSNENLDILIVDSTGKVILKHVMTSEKYNINLNAVQKGVYFIKLQSADKSLVKKVIVN